MGNSLIEIKEYYTEKPLFNPKAAVERMLKGIPQKYLSGLATIIIRDSNSLNHDRRRAKTWSKGKKVFSRECQGLYHEKWKGEPAWIELFIDNIYPSNRDSLSFKIYIKLSFAQDVTLSHTLFHEIGHHIHKTISPEFGERENIAEQWTKKLQTSYFLHKYKYLVIPLIIILWPFLKIKRKNFFRFLSSINNPEKYL